MKSIYKPVLFILGVMQIIMPIMEFQSNGNESILLLLKTLLMGVINAIIYLAVVNIITDNEKNKMKIEDIEKRLDNHYQTLETIKKCE